MNVREEGKKEEGGRGGKIESRGKYVCRNCD